jgi:hypothetical protein
MARFVLSTFVAIATFGADAVKVFEKRPITALLNKKGEDSKQDNPTMPGSLNEDTPVTHKNE